MDMLNLVGGIIPLIIYGALLYLLLWWLPRWIIARRRAGAVPRPTEEPKAPKPRKARAEDAPEPEPEIKRRRSIGTIGSAPSMAEAPLSVAETLSAGAISETLSVILKRQIPPRFDAPLRSWIGGLPCLPAAVEWPRSVSAEHPEQGERPLHFVAQIACADLPADLWGGLGPRHGWLLLFLDPNQGVPEGADAFRILHNESLGFERAAPDDLGPVHDGVYTGPDYSYLQPGAPVPSVWRRWPVDLVAVPNAAREEHGRVRVAPEDLASQLYDGAAVKPGYERPEPMRPLTFGQARDALAVLRRGLERPVLEMEVSDALVGALRDGGLAELIARGGRMADWLAEMGTAEAVADYLRQGPALEQAWQDGARAHVDRVIEALDGHDPATVLEEADWQELVATFAGYRFARWQQDRHRMLDIKAGVGFREHGRSAALVPHAAMHQTIKDYYLDHARRDRLPADAVPAHEACWRDLDNGRPHRMGGYHDGLQSDAVIGPASRLLLFQIASDYAMQWVWGDAGAYYFWIRPERLAANDFSAVEMDLECH